MNSAFLRPVGFIITCVQQCVVCIYKLLLVCWGGYRATLRLPRDLARTKRYIIAANHQSQLDPFAIFAVFPSRQRAKLLPLKFMTIPKVYHRWYVKPFAYLLGCYPAHIRERKHHTYGVSGTIKLLRYGYNVCIFPEGRRTLQSESQPKNGIVRIMQEYPDATLLIAHLQWHLKRFGRRHFTITLKPLPPHINKTDAKAIMDAIYAL